MRSEAPKSDAGVENPNDLQELIRAKHAFWLAPLFSAVLLSGLAVASVGGTLSLAWTVILGVVVLMVVWTVFQTSRERWFLSQSDGRLVRKGLIGVKEVQLSKVNQVRYFVVTRRLVLVTPSESIGLPLVLFRDPAHVLGLLRSSLVAEPAFTGVSALETYFFRRRVGISFFVSCCLAGLCLGFLARGVLFWGLLSALGAGVVFGTVHSLVLVNWSANERLAAIPLFFMCSAVVAIGYLCHIRFSSDACELLTVGFALIPASVLGFDGVVLVARWLYVRHRRAAS